MVAFKFRLIFKENRTIPIDLLVFRFMEVPITSFFIHLTCENILSLFVTALAAVVKSNKVQSEIWKCYAINIGCWNHRNAKEVY